MINKNADARKARSGKDCAVYDGEGTLLATIESFDASVNLSNSQFQPLGSMQAVSLTTGFSVQIQFSELLVKDTKFIKDIMAGMKSGIFPTLNLQGVLLGYDGNEQRVVYRDCVPDGTINLQGFTVGDLIKRSWSFICNSVPDPQSYL